jgi:class III poly(R)-hydroxyalkanoic acid synthase PhaE subunit
MTTKFWNDDWMQLQQQYWQKLNEMGQNAMNPGKSQAESWNATNWENAMQHWWQAISPAMPDANKSFMDKMLEQGSVFYRMNEQLAKNLNKGNDWTEVLNKTFEQLQSAFASQAEKASGNIEEGFSKMMGYWQSPMENWRQMGNSIDINNTFLKGSNLFEKVLHAPGLGYTREDEERYKQLMQSSLHYQHALMDYNRFFSNIGTQAVSCMKDKVQKVADKGETIDSGRAFYDLWVSACEDVYAEHALTPEYAKVHGELVNALMAVKKQSEELVDQRLGMMNMPTRREMRTLQTRLQEARRELRSMSCQVENLQDEMAELKQALLKEKVAPVQSSLLEETPAPAAASTTVKKKVARKKATRKKAASKAGSNA